MAIKIMLYFYFILNKGRLELIYSELITGLSDFLKIPSLWLQGVMTKLCVYGTYGTRKVFKLLMIQGKFFLFIFSCYLNYYL